MVRGRRAERGLPRRGCVWRYVRRALADAHPELPRAKVIRPPLTQWSGWGCRSGGVRPDCVRSELTPEKLKEVRNEDGSFRNRGLVADYRTRFWARQCRRPAGVRDYQRRLANAPNVESNGNDAIKTGRDLLANDRWAGGKLAGDVKRFKRGTVSAASKVQ